MFYDIPKLQLPENPLTSGYGTVYSGKSSKVPIFDHFFYDIYDKSKSKTYAFCTCFCDTMFYVIAKLQPTENLVTSGYGTVYSWESSKMTIFDLCFYDIYCKSKSYKSSFCTRYGYTLLYVIPKLQPPENPVTSITGLFILGKALKCHFLAFSKSMVPISKSHAASFVYLFYYMVQIII